MKKSKLISFAVVFLFIFTHCIATVYGQTKELKQEPVPSPFNQIKIIASPILTQGYKINTIHGGDMLISNPSVSIDLGIEYFQNFRDILGLNIGVHWERLAPSTKTPLSILDPSKDDQAVLHDMPTFHNLYIPISLERKFKLKNHNRLLLSVQAGVSVNYLFSNDLPSTLIASTAPSENHLDQTEYFTYSFPTMTQQWFASYFIKFGISRLFLNPNSAFEINLKANYTPKCIAKGLFNFSNTIESPQSGEIELKNNYIGIEFVYGISLQKGK